MQMSERVEIVEHCYSRTTNIVNEFVNASQKIGCGGSAYLSNTLPSFSFSCDQIKFAQSSSFLPLRYLPFKIKSSSKNGCE